MRKGIAILFLIPMLAANLYLGEVLKLPEFISHYVEHHQNDGIGFGEFLLLHYLKGDVKDADYAKDMQLPFKTLINDSPASNLFTLQANLTPLYPLPIGKLKLHYPIALGNNISGFNSSIWQPPKSI